MKQIILIGCTLIMAHSFSNPAHIIINKAGIVRTAPYSVPSLKKILPSYDTDIVETYFSPHDNIRQKLVEAIDSENHSLKVAIFMLTDGEITKAFLRAFERGVHITIITDPTCLKERFNKITMLSKAGIAVYVYNAAVEGPPVYSCMHHKFIIFGSNKEQTRFVWTGSFNFTKSASDSNQENVVVIHKQATRKRFEEQFEKIRKRSSRLIQSQ